MLRREENKTDASACAEFPSSTLLQLLLFFFCSHHPLLISFSVFQFSFAFSRFPPSLALSKKQKDVSVSATAATAASGDPSVILCNTCIPFCALLFFFCLISLIARCSSTMFFPALFWPITSFFCTTVLAAAAAAKCSLNDYLQADRLRLWLTD